MKSADDKAKSIITAKGGCLRTSDALKAGIHPRTLYQLRDAGILIRLSRGVFQIANQSTSDDPDLVLVSKRVPNGVICLISALAIHDLTTQIPHAVHLAIPRTARYPDIKEVPLQVHRYSMRSFETGILYHDIGNIKIRVYDAEKTIADCFKYRNKIGLDLTIEALRSYRQRPHASMQRILEYARIDRVETRIRPYLEALV